MPHISQDKRWYAGLIDQRRFNVEPVIVTADSQTAVFDSEDSFYAEVTISNHSFLQTAMTGSDNDIDIIALADGDQSAVTFEILSTANNQALAVTETGDDITVESKTDGAGAPTSTAQEVIDAVNSTIASSALVVANLKGADDGTGVVTDFTQDSLSAVPGGTTPTLDPALQGSFDNSTFFDLLPITNVQFTQQTTHVAQQLAFSGLPQFLRYDWDIGASMVFAMAVKSTKLRRSRS